MFSCSFFMFIRTASPNNPDTLNTLVGQSLTSDWEKITITFLCQKFLYKNDIFFCVVESKMRKCQLKRQKQQKDVKTRTKNKFAGYFCQWRTLRRESQSRWRCLEVLRDDMSTPVPQSFILWLVCLLLLTTNMELVHFSNDTLLLYIFFSTSFNTDQM